MTRLTPIALALYLSVFGIALARPVTVDDLMKLRAIVDVRISPDGDRVAYVLSTPSLERNAQIGALFVVPASGGAPMRLAEEVRIFNPTTVRPQLRWSPDSKMIAFLAFADTRPQVFAVPASGGPGRALTSAVEGAFAFEWAPDGERLAFLTRDPMSSEEERQRRDQSFVIHADAPERATRLCVQTIDKSSNGAAKPDAMEAGYRVETLTPSTHYVDGFSWSPDGTEIAYSASTTTGFMSQYFTRIYTVPASGGSPRVIVDRAGINRSPQYSPDGTQIAFISTGGRVEIMAPRGLAVAPARPGQPRGSSPASIRSFPMDDAWVNEFVWARDSRSIYTISNDGTFGSAEHMFEQPVVRVWMADGRAERVVPGATVDYSLSISGDGKRLAYRAVEGRTMGEVVVQGTASGRRAKITEANPELRDLDLGELKAIKWRSFDGMEIWGLFLTPPNSTAGRKLPLLVYCHGGPGGGVTYGLFPQFMHITGQVDPYPTEAMASAGYAVLFPMPRGGAGYGERGQRAIVNAWGEGDYKDIMAGVDHLIAQGIADPDRLGVMGASYGGYMTNWIVTQTGRFKAASSAASVTDLADNYFLSEGGEFMVEYFKRPWENRESYADTFATDVRR